MLFVVVYTFVVVFIFVLLELCYISPLSLLKLLHNRHIYVFDIARGYIIIVYKLVMLMLHSWYVCIAFIVTSSDIYKPVMDILILCSLLILC